MFTRIKEFIKRHYAYPSLSNLDINSSEAVAIHRRIIENNALLKRHYLFVYGLFEENEECLNNLAYPSLEIGSGAGFLKKIIPSVITSDIVLGEGIDRIEDAMKFSFKDASLKAVYANGVLHHLANIQMCLAEIERVLVPGGVFVCNEPSSTLFGYFMNRHFHNEHTDKKTAGWGLGDQDGRGRLTGANMARPYNIFLKERKVFEGRFPQLKITSIVYHDFLRYTLSGGLSFRPFVPVWSYGAVNFLEFLARPLMPVVGNNMIITIQKIERKELR